MRSFKYFRAKDPVLSTVLALGLVVTLPLIAKAELGGGWEEAKPANSRVEQLMSAPPIFGNNDGGISYRPPVSLPQTAEMLFKDETENLQEVSIVADDSDVSADAYYDSSGGTYTIQRGDTLGKIAQNLLGSSQKWRDIAVANPHVNPNKLAVGDTLVIPGSQPTYGEQSYTQPNFAPKVSQPAPVIANPWQPEIRRQESAVSTYQQARVEPVVEVSAPSFDPPPLLAPPPSPASYGFAPQVHSSYGAPTYSSPPPIQAPAAPPAPAPMPPPIYSAAPGQNMNDGYYHSVNAAGGPVAVSTKNIYREERYRIPDELKPTDFLPYFNNMKGYYGLFDVETAFLPYIPTWDLGLHVRHRKYQYFQGDKNIKEGNELYMPMHLTYAYRKMFFGVTLP